MDTAQIFNLLEINPAEFDDLHVSRMLHAFVAVTHGRVIKVTEPLLHYCPLVSLLYDNAGGSQSIDELKKMIIEMTDMKIAKFGHFTERREIERGDIAVPYGASEMIMFAMRKGLLDCAVTVCDCVGTVIAAKPELAQGVGARMNGLFYTTPIPAVIKRFEQEGCVIPFPRTAEISQLEGVRRAAELGYRKIAVTINGYVGESLVQARSLERELGIELTIIIVCTTGATRARIEEIRDYADMVWSCASGGVREIVGPASRIQVSRGIPVFAISPRGVRFLAAYSPDDDVFARLDLSKQYLIAGNKGGTPITMGKMKTSIGESALPVRSKNEPYPLT